MLKRVHHMDYLVRDMDQAIEKFSKVFGPVTERMHIQGVETAFFPVGDVLMALIAPADPETTLGKLLTKRLEEKGEGLWHIGYEVGSVEEAVRTLKAQGVRLLNEKPRLGKDNWKLIDIAEEETCGFMVQLVEP